MPKKNLTPTVALRFDPRMKAELEKLAEAERRSFSNYVRLVLEDHVRAAKAQQSEQAA